MKVLALSVGGTAEPIVQSIGQHKPDRVVFFVSDRPQGGTLRLVVEGDSGKPSIVAQTKLLESQFKTQILTDIDDFETCYREMVCVLREEMKAAEHGEFIADYTGGTKTMSAALAAAAFRLGWKLGLVESPRPNVRQATLEGIAKIQRTVSLMFEELTARVRELFSVGQYDLAAEVLSQAMREIVLDRDQEQFVQRAFQACKAVAHWDRFEYEEAAKHLRVIPLNVPLPVRRHIEELAEWCARGGPPPYTLVWDLAANAQRRAEQGRYEDAILRLYRSIELLAQIRLRETHQLDTSNLDPEILERKLSHDPQRKESVMRMLGGLGSRLTAGLVASYLLLNALGDPLGHAFKAQWEQRTQRFVQLRNKAFMAHGFRPLGQEAWEEAWEHCRAFYLDACRALGISMQLPMQPQWEWVEEPESGLELA